MSNVASPPSGWETRYVFDECRASLTETNTLVGYGIVFNMRSENMGGFKEVILPSAVDRTIREGTDVRSYINHDPNRIIGRKNAGTLTMKKDSRGLRVEIHPPDTSYARDLIASVQRGDVNGMSFRFRALTDDWRMEDGMPLREVSDMVFAEVGPVSEPAYPDTTFAKRSLDLFQESQLPGRGPEWFQRRLRLAGVR